MIAYESRKNVSVRKVPSAPGKITRRRRVPTQANLTAALHKVSPSIAEATKKEENLSNKLFEEFASCAKTIPLPGEMWISYVVCGSHVLFAKVEPDYQLSFKVVIYPDVTKISYYGKVLSWMEPNIKSQGDLIDVLKFLDVLKLPRLKYLP